jgi:gliding motility-associated-like protein
MYKKLLMLGFTCFFCLTALVLRGQIITVGTVTGTITGCVGSVSISPNLQQIIVTASGLSSNITATASANFELSLTATGPYANTITLQQNGDLVYVRSSAATAQVGSTSGNVVFSSVGANSSIAQVNATIKALPVVNTVPNQTLASGSLTAPVNFTGNAPAYQWVNSNHNIGIGAIGSGNIPSFTAVNSSANTVTARFTVTPAPAGFIFTSNANGNSVSMVNTGNNRVVATIPVGNGPYVSLVNPNQQEVYISSFYQNEMHVLNALTGSIIATIATGNDPEYMTTNPDGSILYLVNVGDHTISVINTVTKQVTTTIQVGESPGLLIMSPDGMRLYVATYGNSGYGPIYVINTSTNLVIATIAPTAAPSGIAFSPNGGRVYITDLMNNSMSVINTATNAVIAIIPLGNRPLNPVINADGSRIYVDNVMSNNISVINTANNSVIVTIPVGYYGGGCALSSNGQLLYVTNLASQSVSVISTISNKVIKTIPLRGQLGTPVISPDGTRLYVADEGSNAIHVINTATNTLITDVLVGLNPLFTAQSITAGTGCTGTPITFTITVTPAVPVITKLGSPNSINTTYGIPSTVASFTISGANLSTGITVESPPGFEVSTSNVNFSNTITVGGTNITTPITVYIRLAGTTNAGTYSGNILLSSTNAASVIVNMPNSIVSPAILNLTGTYSKLYGNALKNFTLFYNTPNFTFSLVGLYNGNTFKSVNCSFENGAAGTDPVGTYKGAMTVSGFEGDNGFLPTNYIVNYSPFTLIVFPAPITITAGNVSKPYGTALLSDLASTTFTSGGLQNNETIGNVRISYGAGAPAFASPGLYTVSVVPSGATGGSFSPGNYSITYLPGNLTVNEPPPPAITYTGLPLPRQTIYGTASAATSIQITGTNLTATAGITPPPGFEISIDNSKFGNSIILEPNAGGLITATIYIRLAAITPAGNYTGNLTLNSNGINNINASLSGTVTPALITVSTSPATKTYGITLTGGAGSKIFTATGLQNNETIGSVSLTYGYGAAGGDPAGIYSTSLVPSAAAGGSFNQTNYSVTYAPTSITVNQALLTINADNLSRAFGTPNPAFTITYMGFVNNDGPAQLINLPTVLTYAVVISTAGQYPIVISGALSPNYAITYIPGILTIYAAPQNIIIPNAFTPNGDGINDVWNIKYLQYYPNCNVEIYNRYGQNIYHSRGYGQAWNGRNNDHALSFGTYYYIISLNDGMSTKLSGYVTIVK